MFIGFGYSPSRAERNVGVAFDADAQAFFTAASITDSTQKSAVNQLVLDLKSYNIWTKMTALYPIVGGSASSHAVNLKTPGTYNLTFSTGWTHASTGMNGNGSSSYSDTSLIANTFGTNIHMSMYCRTQSVGGQVEIGSSNNTTSSVQLRPAVLSFMGGVTSLAFTTTSDARGFWIGSKRADNDREIYRNGVSERTNTTNISTALPAFNIWLGGLNNAGSLVFSSSKIFSFASIGNGLTDTESSNFYTAVQAYQTTLSRQV